MSTRKITSYEIWSGSVIRMLHILPSRIRHAGYRNVTDKVVTYIGLSMPDDNEVNVENFTSSIKREVKVVVEPEGIAVSFMKNNRKKTVATTRIMYDDIFKKAVFDCEDN